MTGPDGGTNVYYASPTGMGTGCTSAAPCSITKAQKSVQAAIQANQSDLTVVLADGVYTLAVPLVFTARSQVVQDDGDGDPRTTDARLPWKVEGSELRRSRQVG
jgi:hypothetical protein